MQHKNLRLDELLVELGHCKTRSRAKALILAGKVRRGTVILDKPGKSYPMDISVTVVQPARFVGRGGDKLEAYLEAFPTEVSGKRILDVGASTGGFTDCLLQRGAECAVCVDVGRAQLHHKLLLDPKVTNIEKTNARHLTPDQLPHPDYDLAVMDLSFISLKKVLPAIWPLLKFNGKLIALVKPQFEAEKHLVDKGRGVIHDDGVRMAILEDIKKWIAKHLDGASLEGSIESPIAGGDGNREFLLGIFKK
ncbi:MAG: TlyA family RNA methyltransferase [Verrucomicrobia bacterium]|nr:TlyA family RNA methyltransferase [Verrucomicrobiota bacterium]